MLTKFATKPSAESTVEIQNTFFVGGVNFTVISFRRFIYITRNYISRFFAQNHLPAANFPSDKKRAVINQLLFLWLKLLLY